jgi:hypothetical protein
VPRVSRHSPRRETRGAPRCTHQSTRAHPIPRPSMNRAALRIASRRPHWPAAATCYPDPSASHLAAPGPRHRVVAGATPWGWRPVLDQDGVAFAASRSGRARCGRSPAPRWRNGRDGACAASRRGRRWGR